MVARGQRNQKTITRLMVAFVEICRSMDKWRTVWCGAAAPVCPIRNNRAAAQPLLLFVIWIPPSSVVNSQSHSLDLFYVWGYCDCVTDRSQTRSLVAGRELRRQRHWAVVIFSIHLPGPRGAQEWVATNRTIAACWVTVPNLFLDFL